MATYTADSLAAIAAQFERQADVIGARGIASRLLRDKRELAAEARTWRSAAAMLRDTELATLSLPVAATVQEVEHV